MNALRTSGLCVDNDNNHKRSNVNVNEEKLDTNIHRAKEKIFELVYCNPWDFFITATLDERKYCRTDLEKWHKALTQWIRDYNKKYELTIKFLLIPELHADGKSWHMHGFIYGLPLEHLQRFKLGDKMGKAIAEKVKNSEAVYSWSAYANKFGFCDLEPIKNHEAVSKYVTKYINKSLATSVTNLKAHLYYHSRGLNTAMTLKKGTMSANIVPDYENDYCSITWLEFSPETLNELLSSFI